MLQEGTGSHRVRYAVVGLGHIAQVAVLPAFKHAALNSELAALVSNDEVKRRELSRRYGVPAYSYDRFQECLSAEGIEAVYIALPNDLHKEFAIRAAKSGVHVLCEKPMAVSEDDCEAMIAAANENRVRLMVAYRLHFEQANLEAIQLIKSGAIGEPRIFQSTFTVQVRPGNIRTKSERGGGTLYDLGVYCINAARYIFRSEPTEVCAFSASNGEPRFQEVDEMTSAVLRFPGERLAAFTCSFGSSDVSAYRVVGTKGDLNVDPAYDYIQKLRYKLTVNGTTTTRIVPLRDQFAPELLYFSNCVLNNLRPEPSGAEGLADVRIVRALYKSAETGRPVLLGHFESHDRPDIQMRIKRPPIEKPELVRAQSSSE